mmetsp:Transcript_26626/g.4720  ORF Transcript_26626/g.4720 Transcript_26626/m.4720 type:complete len:90 (-) Transcript_26626:940-1209(-)
MSDSEVEFASDKNYSPAFVSFNKSGIDLRVGSYDYVKNADFLTGDIGFESSEYTVEIEDSSDATNDITLTPKIIGHDDEITFIPEEIVI